MEFNQHDAALIHKTREMIKLINVHLNHFPNHERFGLSNEIRKAAYDVYGGIIEGAKKYYNKTSLTKLDIRHEQLRMFVNLAHELGYYHFKDGKRGHSDDEAFRRYTALSIQINEVGAMIGGWIRSLRAGLKNPDGVDA